MSGKKYVFLSSLALSPKLSLVTAGASAQTSEGKRLGPIGQGTPFSELRGQQCLGLMAKDHHMLGKSFPQHVFYKVCGCL